MLQDMIKYAIRSFIQFLFTLLIPRDKKILVLGLRTPVTKLKKISKDYFMHNTKYLFLKYANNQEGYKFIYLCDDKQMIRKLKSKGFKNIYPRNSLKGLFYTLRAKYWLYDSGFLDINKKIFAGGATCINLWHGVPLKKVGYDVVNPTIKYSKFEKFIFNLTRQKDDYCLINSEYERSCYSTAFLMDKKIFKVLGYPRLDILFNEISNSELFMEEDFYKIKQLKKQGKKLFFYTPTFRDTGKDISGWLKSEKLKNFLKNSNSVLVCKLHFADKNSLNFELTEEFYKMDSNSDIYPVLKYSDALITDYSSIYFDYLLLDKPIIYYPIDLEEYQNKCRGFYGEYESLTAGIKAYNEETLFLAMHDIVTGVDNFKEQRNELRNRMFKYQDGKNCERVMEWIKNLR